VINPYIYRGYRYDNDLSFYYLNSRFYNPETHRFLNADGLLGEQGNILGHNMYAYTQNNPVMFTDSTGYAPEWLKTAAVITGVVLVVAAVTILTCGVGTGTLIGAIAVGAAKGALIGAAVGTAAGVGIGYALNGKEGAIEGAMLGFGGGALAGAIVGGSIYAYKFTAATNYLSSNGVPQQFHKEIIQSFKGMPKVKTLQNPTTVYRYWGGNASELGRWITPNIYTNPINSLALPAGNTATNLSTFILQQGTSALYGTVAGVGPLVGGGMQYFISNPNLLLIP
jgi:RHS repeat-associated protein